MIVLLFLFTVVSLLKIILFLLSSSIIFLLLFLLSFSLLIALLFIFLLLSIDSDFLKLSKLFFLI
jgi:hypothetical protein